MFIATRLAPKHSERPASGCIAWYAGKLSEMKMQAVLLREFGSAEMLSYEMVDMPAPGREEILVRVEAVSINRSFDILARQGRSPQALMLPLILGADPTGTIVKVGADVPLARMGERVFVSAIMKCGACDGCRRACRCNRSKFIGASAPGGYAEYLTVPAFQALTLPPTLEPAVASLVCRHAGAAQLELDTADLKAGETVLVMGAAGALGSFLIQLAKLAGASVIASAGSEAKRAACLELGADHVIDYTALDFTEQVLALTHDRGVEVVFENVSDPVSFPKAFASLAEKGRLVTMGYHAGGVVPVDMKRLFLKQLRILSTKIWSPGDDVLAHCLDLAVAGKLKALIGARLPLARAAEGHRIVEEGTLVGKVILEPQTR
jgi:NADPH2:quinone reductase